jgi:PadR family transcriptional regulator PadR
VTDTSGRFLVLLALSHGPKHGYEIARHLEERSGGVFTLSFGALYPVLHRLELDGLASATWDDDGGKRRKVYALTRAGAAALAVDRADLDRRVEALKRLA